MIFETQLVLSHDDVWTSVGNRGCFFVVVNWLLPVVILIVRGVCAQFRVDVLGRLCNNYCWVLQIVIVIFNKVKAEHAFVVQFVCHAFKKRIFTSNEHWSGPDLIDNVLKNNPHPVLCLFLGFCQVQVLPSYLLQFIHLFFGNFYKLDLGQKVLYVRNLAWICVLPFVSFAPGCLGQLLISGSFPKLF